MRFEKEKIDYRKVDVIIHKIKSIWKMEKKKNEQYFNCKIKKVFNLFSLFVIRHLYLPFGQIKK